MVSKNTRIRDLIDLPPIKTVVQLSDLQDKSVQKMLVESFIITEEVGENLTVILKMLSDKKGQGIFLEGNFGSGKSHFLTILASVLEDPGNWKLLTAQERSLLNYTGILSRQKFTVLKISLVEHASSELLETIISQAAVGAGLLGWDNLKRTRKERFSRLFANASMQHSDGIVILIDELSEFLRSKADGRAFNEEIRFLQYLGEFSLKHPLWIISTLQERIEDTGEITQETFNKIKDRYPVRLFLGSHHVEELISKRLVKKKDAPQTAEIINQLYSSFKNAFETFPVSREKFNRIYPVHPATVDMLDNLKVLFSQHRGVVDFIHYQLSGDERRSIKGLLDEPAERLLTPDFIFDHFQVRIKDTLELNPYLEVAFRYFEKQIPQIYGNEREQQTALQIVKILILAAISPRKSELDIQQISDMLVYRITDLDSEINYRFVADILEKLYQHGAYLSYEKNDNFLKSVYRIDLEANVSAIVQRKIETILSELSDEDCRVYQAIIRQFTEPFLPLGLFVEQPENREEFIWQQTSRAGWRIFSNLNDLSNDRLREIAADIQNCNSDFFILIASLEKAADQKKHFERELRSFLADLNILDHTLLWLPAQIQDPTHLKEFYALNMLLNKYREDQSDTGRKIFDFLNLRINEIQRKVKESIAAAYLDGDLLIADYPEKLEQTGLLPFSKMMVQMVDRLLSRLHPKHMDIAPYSPLYSITRLNDAISRFFRAGSISQEFADSSLRATLENYLKPLGLLARSGGNYLLRVDPRICQPVQFALELLADEPLDVGHLFMRIHRSAFGISREQFNFLLLAIIFSGNAIPYSQSRKISLDKITAYNLDQILKIGKGNILEERNVLALHEIDFVDDKLKKKKFSRQVQEQIFEYVRQKINDSRETISFLNRQLTEIKSLPEFRQFPTDSFEKQTEALQNTLDKINLGRSSKDGLQNLVAVFEQTPLFNEEFRNTEKLAQFFYDYRPAYMQIINYVRHSELFIPEGEPYRPLIELRNEIETLLREKDLVVSEKFQLLINNFHEFQKEFISRYLVEHQRQKGNETRQRINHLRNSRAYQLLNRLSTLRKINVLPSASQIEAQFNKISGSVCEKASPELLRIQPACVCGFKLGVIENAEDAFSHISLQIQNGIDSYFKALNDSENLDILKEFGQKAASLKQKEKADVIQEFLSLADATNFAGWVDPGKIKILKEALEGQLVIHEMSVKEFLGNFLNRTVEASQFRQYLLNWLDGMESGKKNVFIRLTEEKKTPAIQLSQKIARHSPFIFNMFPEWKEANWQKLLTAAFWFREHQMPFGQLIRLLEKPLPAENMEEFTNELGVLLNVVSLQEIGEPEEQLLYDWFDKFYQEIEYSQLTQFVLDEQHFFPLLRHALEKALKIAVNHKPAARSLDPSLIFTPPRNAYHLAAHHLLKLLPQFFALQKSLEKFTTRDTLEESAAWWNQKYVKTVYMAPYLTDLISSYLKLFDLQPMMRDLLASMQQDYQEFCSSFRKMFSVLSADVLENKQSPFSITNLLPFTLRRLSGHDLHFVLIDGLRWDIFQVVKERILNNLFPAIKQVTEYSVWTILPSNTRNVMEKLSGSLGTLNLKGMLKENSEKYRALVSEEVELAPDVKIHKINAVDSKIHTSRDNLVVFTDEVLIQIKTDLERYFQKIPGNSSILIFSDHGFTANPGFDTHNKYQNPRYQHGGNSPSEIIIPAVLLKKI